MIVLLNFKRLVGVMVLLVAFVPFVFPKATEKLDSIMVNSHTAAAQVTKEKLQKEKSQGMVVEFKGDIYRDLETHYYKFSTKKKGTIDLSWGPGTVGSDYIITDENWGAMYFNGDVLPAGDYMLVVTTNPSESPEDPSLLSYHFILKGLTFAKAPDTSLPKLTIDNPRELVTNIPDGEQTITFKGSSDSENLVFGTFGLEQELTESLSSPFEKTIYFSEGSPYYSAYRISATNESGNTVNRYFEFIYMGGVLE